MKEIIEKISSYHILNYLLPGVIFVILTKKFVGYDLITNNLVLALFLYYFIGLSISRIGSLLIDPALKKISFIKLAPYKDFITASHKDSKLDDLSEVNNMYRSLATQFLLLLILKLWRQLEQKSPWLSINHYWILIAVLLMIFTFSYRKQTRYITDRINNLIKK